MTMSRPITFPLDPQVATQLYRNRETGVEISYLVGVWAVSVPSATPNGWGIFRKHIQSFRTLKEAREHATILVADYRTVLAEAHTEALAINEHRTPAEFAEMLGEIEEKYAGDEQDAQTDAWIARHADTPIDHRTRPGMWVLQCLAADHAEALEMNGEYDAHDQIGAWTARHNIPSGHRHHMDAAIQADHAEALTYAARINQINGWFDRHGITDAWLAMEADHNEALSADQIRTWLDRNGITAICTDMPDADRIAAAYHITIAWEHDDALFQHAWILRDEHVKTGGIVSATLGAKFAGRRYGEAVEALCKARNTRSAQRNQLTPVVHYGASVSRGDDYTPCGYWRDYVIVSFDRTKVTCFACLAETTSTEPSASPVGMDAPTPPVDADEADRREITAHDWMNMGAVSGYGCTNVNSGPHPYEYDPDEVNDAAELNGGYDDYERCGKPVNDPAHEAPETRTEAITIVRDDGTTYPRPVNGFASTTYTADGQVHTRHPDMLTAGEASTLRDMVNNHHTQAVGKLGGIAVSNLIDKLDRIVDHQIDAAFF